MKIMDYITVVLLMFGVWGVGYSIGIGVGLDEGILKGRQYMLNDVRRALEQGLQDGHDFYLGTDELNIIKDIQFMPRKDGSVAFREVKR